MSENLRDEMQRALKETWRDRAMSVSFDVTWRAMTDAAWEVVGPELDRLHVEVKRLKRQERGQTTAAQTAWRAADVSRERVKAAEAECDVLRAEVERSHSALRTTGLALAAERVRLAKVEALADDLLRVSHVLIDKPDTDGEYDTGKALEAVVDDLRTALASVPEPSDSEPADGVTVVASTPDGVERWTEYGVQADDGSVPWVYAEEGLARLRADMSGGLVVGSTVTRSPWLPVLMDAADAYRKKPAPDADREAGER